MICISVNILGALKINEIREQKNWSPLAIIQVPLLEEAGSKLSSSTLRENDSINRA